MYDSSLRMYSYVHREGGSERSKRPSVDNSRKMRRGGEFGDVRIIPFQSFGSSYW
jgi:hypothetical protein